ncbi:hypothetical protein [Anaeromicropila herbilytica]|uniref:Uncharacterized protein n=1 Tax=Anaeromicropila herbilytica TaxID=2785025 RepID=A0A7R7EIU0_9FIRM|nr:hypothetical protein [Anaeromicropila herbilytica]BCN29550.1 hypothetical protein bsdtb5_08450 [Anaeromicropila herbilytica]
MSLINLIQYSKLIEPHKATKIKEFNKFLCNEFNIENINEGIDVYIFEEIDIDFIIRGLNCYIEANNVSAQNTADTFVAAVYELLVHVEQKYGTKNNILSNIDKHKEFMEKTKEVTSKLRSTVSKDIATDDDFEKLVNCVDLFLEEHDDIESELSNEINLLISNRRNKLWHYPNFISIIATKLLMVYGLKYNVIISLNVNEVDLENRNIIINGILLPINSDLVALLKIYMPIRKQLVTHYNNIHKKLLVSYITGGPYGSREYGKLYNLIIKNFKSFEAEVFASKKILEMLDNGLDTYLVSKLTGFDVTRCVTIQYENRTNDRSEEYCIDKIREFLSNKKQVGDSQFINCPFCGAKKNANIENWIIVKFEDDNNKYIACKECKGLAN